jgi:hypothetical protein
MTDGIFTPDELEADQAGPAAELPAHEPAEQGGQDRARGPDGKFLPKEETPAPEAGAEAEGEQKKGDGTVPQGALHAEREKRKGADERAGRPKPNCAAQGAAGRDPEDARGSRGPQARRFARRRRSGGARASAQAARADREPGHARHAAHGRQALGQQELQQLGSFMAQSEARFRAEKPDYDAAIITSSKPARASFAVRPEPASDPADDQPKKRLRSSAPLSAGPRSRRTGYQIAQARGYRPQEGGQPKAAEEHQAERRRRARRDRRAPRRRASRSARAADRFGQNADRRSRRRLDADEFDAIYSTPEGKAMIDAL